MHLSVSFTRIQTPAPLPPNTPAEASDPALQRRLILWPCTHSIEVDRQRLAARLCPAYLPVRWPVVCVCVHACVQEEVREGGREGERESFMLEERPYMPTISGEYAHEILVYMS